MGKQRMFTIPFRGDLAAHPIYIRDARRIYRAWSRGRRRITSAMMLIYLHVGVFGVWFIFFSQAMLFPTIERQPDIIYSVNGGIIAALFLLSLLLNFALDFISMQAANRSISEEISRGRWDLLRMTPLKLPGILEAKHQVAQLQAWRSMLLVSGMRGAVLSLLAFSYGPLPLLMVGESQFLAGMVRTIVAEPLAMLLLLGLLGFGAAMYLAEPLWRMKAMTALGVMVSSYADSPPLATLASFGVITVVWIAQLIIAFSLMVGLGALVLPFLFLIHLQFFALLLLLLLTGCIAAAMIYGFYLLVCRWSLRHALRRIAHFN